MYYGGFYLSGSYYGVVPFFAASNWCPTDWLFYANQGRWYRPGWGYFNQAPQVSGPITVVVVEHVPVTDAFGNPVLDVYGNPMYEDVTVYYNAFYNQAAGCYGYYNQSGSWILVRW